MPSNAELFLQHLQSIFGDEDSIQRAPADDGGPPVSVFVYRNIPEPGMITGVTYGLSHCPHPAWKHSRPELIVSVESLELDWPCAAATFVSGFRGKKKFQYGDVFTTDVSLAPDTQMNGFLLFAQSLLDEEWQTVQLNDYKINFSQFYPIYSSELSLYSEIGLEAFFKHEGFDLYNPAREPIR